MKNLKSSCFLLCSALLLFTLSSCEYNNQGIADVTPQLFKCDTIPHKFKANVRPLIIANCATSGCHEANMQQPALDDTATIYTTLLTYLNDGQFEKRVITRSEKPMPPNGPLSESELQIIKCWFEGEHPNN